MSIGNALCLLGFVLCTHFRSFIVFCGYLLVWRCFVCSFLVVSLFMCVYLFVWCCFVCSFLVVLLFLCVYLFVFCFFAHVWVLLCFVCLVLLCVSLCLFVCLFVRPSVRSFVCLLFCFYKNLTHLLLYIVEKCSGMSFFPKRLTRMRVPR